MFQNDKINASVYFRLVFMFCFFLHKYLHTERFYKIFYCFYIFYLPSRAVTISLIN